MKFHLYISTALLVCATCSTSNTPNGNALAARGLFWKQTLCLPQNHSDKPPKRTVNSTHEDALVLNATIEALLKFPPLRGVAQGQSLASKMIVHVIDASDGDGFFPSPFTKGLKHPMTVFMDEQFEKQVPEEALTDLDRRNVGATSWSKYKPGNPHIVTMDNEEIDKTYRQFDDPEVVWHENNPDFAGIVTLSLPGYSRHRNIALLRFGYAPTPHGCFGSCLLEKVRGKWIVKRIEIQCLA